jgi:CopG family transcriptional regulator, nickel-responsive regulator
MSKLVRCSLSIDPELFKHLEKLVETSGYENRSEFVRDLIREKIVEKKWEKNELTLGTLTIIFDHHQRNLNKNLTAIQHHNHSIILASTHIHLSHELCAEMIMMKGKAVEIQDISNKLSKQIGVLHSTLSMSAPGLLDSEV